MKDHFDRREFARRAVLSSLAVGTAGVASAQETEPAEAAGSETEPLGKTEELLLEIIRRQYPSENLTPEVLNQIERDIVGHRGRSGVLKSVPLTNGEAPFVFRAYRGTEADETESIQIRPRKTPDTKRD